MFYELKGSVSIESVELGSSYEIWDISNLKIAVKIQLTVGHLWLVMKVQSVHQTISLFEVYTGG